MKQFILACLLTVGLFSCSNYGKKVSKDYLEIYYKDGATEKDAQKMLDYLYPLWKEDEGKTPPKSVQLTKSGDTINFRMVVDKDKLAKMGDETFQLMSSLFSDSVFSGTPVNMVFTDDNFKTIRTLAFKKRDISDNNFGDKVTAGAIEVYAKDGISPEQAEKMANFLQSKFGPNANITSFQVSNADDGGYLVRMVSQKEKAETFGDDSFYALAQLLSEDLFNGEKVTFELTDGRFNPYKKFVFSKEQVADTTTVTQ